MDYDLIIAINFSKFNESNFENDVFKFVKATALDEFDLKAFEYKHQNLVQEDPYIGIYQYTKNDKAFPLRRFDDKICESQIPVINLTCPLQGEFFQQYLALLQSSINKLKAIQDIKSAKIYICGHGKDINSLGTGDDKLNNGCVTYEDVLAILNDLFLSKAKGIEVLDLNLISCEAANKNSHDYLFSLIYNKFKIPSFSVVAYRENISLGAALISEKIKHQECRSSTEYSKFDGIESFVEVISREFTEKIMKNSQYSSDKLQDIIKGCYAKCKFQYNMHFLNYLKNALFDFINQHESDFYPELNNDYIRKRYLKPDSSELLSLAKALLEETIQFENTAMVYVKNVVKDREKWNGLFFDKTTYSSSKTDLSLI